jgi:uncharacterized protein (TIGR00661 family)
MRILYGIHGYGRGHATRTLAVLPHLAGRHQLLILTGGDAYAAVSTEYPAVRIPTLGFAYGRGSGRRSNWHTFRRNFSAVLDLVGRGPVFDMVCDLARDFAPDVVISDAEAWTHRVAAWLRIPRISIDHIGILAYCRPPVEWHDRLESWFDTFIYRKLMGRPDRIIVSSFYPAPPRRPGACVVGTLPRAELYDLKPTTGDHVLVYFNRGQEQLRPDMLTALGQLGCPVHVYGTDRRGRDGPLTFLPPSNLPFVEDLAGCRAVLSTAGNQLVGEAMHLGKPVLVVPERCVEQRLNAAAVERLGIGVRLTRRQFTGDRLRAFLADRDRFTANIARHARDGRQETLDVLDRFLAELAPAASGSSPAAIAPREAS